MSKTEFKNMVNQIIRLSTGIKVNELACNRDVAMSGLDLWEDALNPLIKDGEVIELEYVVPSSDYRIKSILFPKGTIFPSGD